MVTQKGTNTTSVLEEMRKEKRWIPLNGKTPSISGWNKPENWMTLNGAKAKGPGVGFVLGDGLACFDFDDVIAEDGSILDEVRRIVERLDSYTEISMSGKGLHVFVRVDESLTLKDITGSGKVREEAGFEFYSSSNRFIALTGNVFEGRSELRNATSEVLEILTPIYGTSEASPAKSSTERKHWSELRPDLKHSPGVTLAYAKAYVRKKTPAKEGAGGSVKFMGACSVLSQGFLLNYEEALPILEEYNERCEPPFDTFASSGPNSLSKKLEDSYKLKSSEHEPGSLLKAIPFQPDPFAGAEDGRRRFSGRSMQELSYLEGVPVEWVIDGVIAKGNPSIWGAAKKSLKTLLSCDVAIALATGSPWLGKFEVPKRLRVLFITGESSDSSISRPLMRALRKRGLKPEDVEGWLFTEAVDFPKLMNPKDLFDLHQTVVDLSIDVVIFDPFYMGMDGSTNSANLFEMGDALKRLRDAVRPAEIIICHHTKKTAVVRSGAAPDLDDLSGAGLAEFAGNYCLFKRQVPFAPGEKHDLIVVYGGREGHSGAFRLLFDEPNWDAEILPVGSFKAEKKAKADEERKQGFIPRITQTLQSYPEGLSASKLAQECRTKANRDVFKQAVDYLVGNDEIELISDFKAGSKVCTGYRLASGPLA